MLKLFLVKIFHVVKHGRDTAVCFHVVLGYALFCYGLAFPDHVF